MKIEGKEMITILTIFIGVILLLLALILLLFLIKGKGSPISLCNEAGELCQEGISIREKVKINGMNQGMFIVGENINNPLLLFLHGGPGAPEIAFHSFEEGKRLEKDFIVCYWEQRGSGLSYGKDFDISTLNLKTLIKDTISVTEYLLQKFNQEKIFVMGHSWGTFLGIKVIQTRPEYFRAYFGVGQIVNQKKSEVLAYQYMLDHAYEIKDEEAIKNLEKFDCKKLEFPTEQYLFSIRSKYMNKYGIGLMHEENLKSFKFIKQLFWFTGYSMIDFIKMSIGNMKSVKALSDSFTSEDLAERNCVFDIPVYFFHGRYDYQVSYEIAYDYFKSIKSPQKEFYTFEKSAHSPNFEEPKKFIFILNSIVSGMEF